MSDYHAPVSVIIPCFNCKDTIKRALDSVYLQTLRPAEVILIDDCSEDDTLEYIKLIRDDYPSNWITVIELSKNSGVSIARNAGWDVASQEYIAFLDADDSWHSKKILIQYSWMREHPEVTLTGHKYIIQPNNKKHLVNKSPKISSHFIFINKYKMLLKTYFPTPTVMIKRNIRERFNEEFRYGEDLDLWLRLSLRGHICMKSQDELAYIYKESYGSSGLSSNLLEMHNGTLDCLRNLYKLRLINNVQYKTLVLFYNFKFIRRVIVARLVRPITSNLTRKL